MSDSDANFVAAHQLEDIRFSQLVSEAAVQREAEIQALQRSLAAKGRAVSGERFLGEVNIIFKSIESILDTTIAYRRDLGNKVPALFTSWNLKIFQEKLDQHIEGAVGGVRNRLALQPRNHSFEGALLQEAERRAYALKSKVRAELAALPLEARLGMHREARPVTTFNISHSTIATLNLGTVVGDLNSSIQTLNSAGQSELAQAVRHLTESIGASTDLNDASRKDLLEHLALVSGEAALPVEKRKMGPLRTSIEALRSGVAVATQLLTLWQGVEHALKATGVLPQ